MNIEDLMVKDESIFKRDNYTCLTCDAREDSEDLWVFPHESERPTWTICSECAQKSIDAAFDDEELEEEKPPKWVQGTKMVSKGLSSLLGATKKY